MLRLALMINFNPLKRHKPYSHLLKKDVRVWERFLRSEAHRYSHFDYDVRVGDGRDPGPEHSDNIRHMAIQLSQRRIDAVAHASNHLAIIEITTVAGIKAFGQCKVYPILYAKAYPFHPPIKMILVAERLGTDVEPAFTPSEVQVMLFPPT
jgi:hypothetical protein